MSLLKAFSRCSLSDLTLAISARASAATDGDLDSATADRLLPPLCNAALTEAVLLRHPLVRDCSGLKCDASVSSKRAWCSMLRDLFDAAGVDVSDAALLRVYLVCKQCAKRGRVHASLMFEYHDRFLGKVVRVPVVQHLQIVAPLMLVAPALRVARGRAAPGTALHQPPLPIGYMQVAFWAAQRARFMPSFTLAACNRLATAPASAHVYFRTAWRWRTRILERVMACHVSKVQVWLLMCKGLRCLLY